MGYLQKKKLSRWYSVNKTNPGKRQNLTVKKQNSAKTVLTY